MSEERNPDDWEGPAPEGLIGHDVARYARTLARKMEAEHAKLEETERKEAAEQKELAGSTYYLAVRKVLGGVEVSTCELLPLVNARMTARGRNWDHALSQLWYGIAKLLVDGHWTDDWDYALSFAVERYHFRPSLGDLQL